MLIIKSVHLISVQSWTYLKFCASDIFSISYKPFITMYFLLRHHRMSSRPIHMIAPALGLGIALSSYYWKGTFFSLWSELYNWIFETLLEIRNVVIKFALFPRRCFSRPLSVQ